MTKEEEQNDMNGHQNHFGERLPSLTVAVVGLGLMGGSLAMALKSAVGKVVGIDLDADTLKLAERSGVADEVVQDLSAGVSEADLIVLAIPVQQIVTMVKAMPDVRPDGCMLLDLGSTKTDIELAMDSLPSTFEAVGGHPMCGREYSGLAGASGDLFDGETFILCRNKRTTAAMEATALELVARIGSYPLFMPASMHDRLVATSSHLPYVVSSVLMNRASAEAEKDERLWQVSASGLRDTTRLSGSSPEMMLEIMLTNRQPLLAQIEAYQAELTILSEALRRQDAKELRSLLRSAQQRRGSYLHAKHGSESNPSDRGTD